MVPAYFVFTFLLLVLIYNISTGNNQFANTASLIRQIWSGRCTSCPPNTFSEFSVQSGTVDTNQASNLRRASHNCVCDSCPCALVENLLAKCSPITNVLQETVNTLAQLFNNIVCVIAGVYEDFTRVLECGGTCQNPGSQVFDNTGNTSAATSSFTNLDAAKKISNVQDKKSNIGFIIDADDSSNKGKSKKKKNQEPSSKDESKTRSNQGLNIKEHKSRSNLELINKNDSKTRSSQDINIIEHKSKTNHEPSVFMKKEKDKKKLDSESSDDTSKPSDSALGSYCFKCKQENKICSAGCPKSKK